ncbi:MAG: ribonuclease H-like domain-containing protein, partial [candidate division Zixibacteria bacterium]|nr:ribonuclease H-like domain-containing protein [candidate division Zixibacteria bacterium]
DSSFIPQYIESNYMDWKTQPNLELYVDFEMTCGVLNDIDDIDNNNTDSYIFMIGVGHINHDGEWVYKDFTAEKLNPASEAEVCNDFINYVRDLSEYYGEKQPKLFHWSHAEPSAWNRAMRRHYSYDWVNLKWFDLLKLFHTEPIGIKGALNYSLKTVARAMASHGFINTLWDESSSCINGADAALGAHRVYQELHKTGQSVDNDPQIQEIIKYNEVDCKVLYEIIDYLRQYRIDPNDIPYDDDWSEDITFSDGNIGFSEYGNNPSEEDSLYEPSFESDETY